MRTVPMMEMQALLEEFAQSVPRMAIEKVLTDKLAAAGEKVSKKTLTKMADAILAGKTRNFRIPSKGPNANITLTEDDANQIVELVENFNDDGWQKIVESSAESVAKILYNALYRRLPKEIRAQQKDMNGFRRRLDGRYGVGLHKLRMMLTIAREWAGGIHERKLAQSGELSTLDDVLYRLHVRACQVVTEIIVLLENGLADGAMARWRTLHELTTVATFIHTHGEEVAVKYKMFQIVESKRAADLFDKNYAALGYKPLSEKVR